MAADGKNKKKSQEEKAYLFKEKTQNETTLKKKKKEKKELGKTNGVGGVASGESSVYPMGASRTDLQREVIIHGP